MPCLFGFIQRIGSCRSSFVASQYLRVGLLLLGKNVGHRILLPRGL
jgi:hypothetical protein